MQELSLHLSKTLKTLRKDRGWSLDRAATETGVSKAMLGQIERAESSPTLATLWKLAGGFKVSMSVLTDPPLEECNTEVTIRRSAEKLRRRTSTDQMLVATLFPFDRSLGFEMFELTMPVGYERFSEAHEPGVTEHIVVVSGEMELYVDGNWTALKVGDAIRFGGDQLHGYRNLKDTTAVFHNLIFYP